MSRWLEEQNRLDFAVKLDRQLVATQKKKGTETVLPELKNLSEEEAKRLKNIYGAREGEKFQEISTFNSLFHHQRCHEFSANLRREDRQTEQLLDIATEESKRSVPVRVNALYGHWRPTADLENRGFGKKDATSQFFRTSGAQLPGSVDQRKDPILMHI